MRSGNREMSTIYCFVQYLQLFLSWVSLVIPSSLLGVEETRELFFALFVVIIVRENHKSHQEMSKESRFETIIMGRPPCDEERTHNFVITRMNNANTFGTWWNTSSCVPFWGPIERKEATTWWCFGEQTMRKRHSKMDRKVPDPWWQDSEKM